jgi:hypothetical protein
MVTNPGGLDAASLFGTLPRAPRFLSNTIRQARSERTFADMFALRQSGTTTMELRHYAG